MVYYYLTGIPGSIESTFNAPLQCVSDWYEDALNNSFVGIGQKIAKFVGATFLLLAALPLRALGSMVNLMCREKIPADIYDKEFKKMQDICTKDCIPDTIQQLIRARLTSISYKKMIIRSFYITSNPQNVFCPDGLYSDLYPVLQESRPGDFIIMALPQSRASRFNYDAYFKCQKQTLEQTVCTNDIPSGMEDVKSLNWKRMLIRAHDRDQREHVQKVHALYLDSPHFLEDPQQRKRIIEVLKASDF